VLGALALPGPPHRGLLLGDAHEDDASLARSCRGLEVGTRRLLLGFALLEVDDGNAVVLGEPVDRRDIGVPQLAQGRRRRIGEPPAEEEASHQAGRLEVAYVGPEEDPVDRAAGQRDPVPQ
jgi:hypothetical protein